MIKNVSYKLCTCDICGRHTAEIGKGIMPPRDWTRMTADAYFDFDACPDCARATLKFFKERKNSFKRAGDTDE